MNDFGALQNLIESANKNIDSNYNLTLTIALFVSLNLLLTGLDIFFQFRLKDKEKGINKQNLRETKRIDAQENLYTLLEELTYYDGNDARDFQQKSNGINKFLTQKKIYLTNEIIGVSQEFNDYFLTVLTDYINKNYATEEELLSKYSEIFNKD